MHTVTLSALLMLMSTAVIPATAHAGDTTRCSTREDVQAKRLITTCNDGSRSVSRYDVQAQRWYTDIVRAPESDKALRGWRVPGKAPQR
jgi:hypothetical protein